MNFKRLTFFCIAFVILHAAGFTQIHLADSVKVKRKILWRGYYQNGKVFQTNTFLRYNQLTKDDVDHFHAVSIQALWQTNGMHSWEKNFGYPRLGLGIWSAQFFDAPNLGIPVAVYGLFNAPLASGKKWSWDYEFEMGMAFNWKSFNPITNKQNIAIGDDETFYLDLGTYLEYKVSPKISVELGVSLSHFSNGALKLPNYGINTMAPKFVLQYRPSETRFVKPAVEELQKISDWELQMGVYGGADNVLYTGSDVDSITKYKGVYFPQTGILLSLNRQISKMSKFGVGVSLGYNGTANSRILIDGTELDEQSATFSEGFEVSIFPSYEFVIDRASVIFQPGFYLYRQKYDGRRPAMYQRIGIKYHFLPNLYAGISLRAYNFYISDYIEWNVGYRIRWGH